MPCIQQALSKCSVGGWTGWSTLAILVCRVTLRAYQMTPGGSPCGEDKTLVRFGIGGTFQRKRKEVAVLAVEKAVMG